MKTQLRKSKWLTSDPEWEATKAGTRNLRHADAVAECAALSELYFQMWQPRLAGLVDLNAILQTLRTKKIPFVLTGAHGFSGWTGRPRATYDVDLLVKSGRNFSRAVNALKALYPDLEVRQFEGGTGFFAPGETDSLIDVIYPQRADQEATLLTAVWVEEGRQKYRVPSLESALANKYGAMLSPHRDLGRRALDVVDFYWMVRHSLKEGRTPIDLDRLEILGQSVQPCGGGRIILQLVEEAKAGRVPNVNLS